MEAWMRSGADMVGNGKDGELAENQAFACIFFGQQRFDQGM
jgi:hypothetical protein